MSKAMNRPLLSVLAGGFGGSNSAAGAGEGLEGTMKETSADDLAVQLVYAEKVIFVPGFGLAQAQASVSSLTLAPCSRTMVSKSPTPSIRWQAVCLAI